MFPIFLPLQLFLPWLIYLWENRLHKSTIDLHIQLALNRQQHSNSSILLQSFSALQHMREEKYKDISLHFTEFSRWGWQGSIYAGEEEDKNHFQFGMLKVYNTLECRLLTVIISYCFFTL